MQTQQIKLYDFQRNGLEQVKSLRRCAFFWSMGLGKSFVGSEKLMSLNNTINLIVCQKSKIEDWFNHISEFYDVPVFKLNTPKGFAGFLESTERRVGVINYDLLWRRKELLSLEHVAAIFDESSMIKRTSARRTKAALKLKLDGVVLLSGTPVGGQYENLWSQCKLLGWRMSEDAFLDRYVVYRDFFPPNLKWPISVVAGYRHTEEMLQRMRTSGANFLKTEDVITLPEQVFIKVDVPQSTEYKKFEKDGYVKMLDREFEANNLLSKLIFARQICSGFSKEKEQAFKDLVESTNERLVVFYNFNSELNAIVSCVGDRPLSIVNGSTRDLSAYENNSNAVVAVQFQAGAKGLNLQRACHMVLYSPTVVAEDYMQALKRIHRIGQHRSCFYYLLTVKNSVETHIYKTLEKKEDYTLAMFRHDFSTIV